MKFVNAGQFYRADVLVMGGDMTGKVIVPVVARSGDGYVAQLLGRPYEAEAEAEVAELEKLIRMNGPTASSPASSRTPTRSPPSRARP